VHPINKRPSNTGLVSLPALMSFHGQVLTYEDTQMEIPKYLLNALYQFSEDVLAERDHFDELKLKAEQDAIKVEEQKENWFTHLFREKKTY
jgi:hypothetical protein